MEQIERNCNFFRHFTLNYNQLRLRPMQSEAADLGLYSFNDKHGLVSRKC